MKYSSNSTVSDYCACVRFVVGAFYTKIFVVYYSRSMNLFWFSLDSVGEMLMKKGIEFIVLKWRCVVWSKTCDVQYVSTIVESTLIFLHGLQPAKKTKIWVVVLCVLSHFTVDWSVFIPLKYLLFFLKTKKIRVFKLTVTKGSCKLPLRRGDWIGTVKFLFYR